MKKLFAVVLVLCMLVTSASAFEWLIDYDEAQYDWLLDTSPITLEVRAAQAEPFNDETCKSIPKLAAATGVRLQRTATGDSDGTGIMLALASNDLPDIMLVPASADYLDNFIAQAIATDQIWSFDDLVEQYAPHFKELVDPEQFTEFQEEDGKTYKFVTAINSQRYLDARAASNNVGTPAANLIRWDWYEEIGAPEMTTPDSFVAALKAIQANHPDAYGWCGPTDNWSSAYSQFSAWFGTPLYQVAEDGTVHDAAFTEQAREAAMFANRLYLEGLLPKEDMLTSFDLQANVFAGNVICYKWNTAEEGKKVDDTDTAYHVIRPFDTFKTFSSASIGGWNAILISKKCENPARAIRLVEFLVSQEGHKLLYWGNQGPTPAEGGAFDENNYEAGPHWFMNEDGRPTFYSGYMAAQNADWEGSHAKAGLHEIAIGENNLYNNMVNWDNSSAFEAMKADYYGGKTSIPARQFNIKVPAGDEDLQDIKNAIKQVKIDYASKIVYAESAEEAAAMYDEMLESLEDAGESDMSACFTEQYLDNCEKFGIEP